MKWIKTFESINSQKYLEVLSCDILHLMSKRTIELNLKSKDDSKFLNGLSGAYLPNLNLNKYDDEVKNFITETKLGVYPTNEIKSFSKTSKASGSFTGNMIYLSVENEFMEKLNNKLTNPEVYGDYVTPFNAETLYFDFWYEFYSTLLHELQHAWDYWKSKSKYTNTKKFSTFRNKVVNYNKEQNPNHEKEKEIFLQYRNLQHEINARFTQAIQKTRFWSIGDKSWKQIKKPFSEVLKNFKLDFEGWREIPQKEKNRLVQRLYQFWKSDYNKTPNITKKDNEAE